jgi:hypothetical protein
MDVTVQMHWREIVIDDTFPKSVSTKLRFAVIYYALVAVRESCSGYG